MACVFVLGRGVCAGVNVVTALNYGGCHVYWSQSDHGRLIVNHTIGFRWIHKGNANSVISPKCRGTRMGQECQSQDRLDRVVSVQSALQQANVL